MIPSISVVIINHKTIELTKKAIKSIYNFYQSIPILVIDNGSKNESRNQLKEMANKIPVLNLIFLKENINHGPALDLAFKKVQTDWILTFDSDCEMFKRDLIEDIFQQVTSNTYAIGKKNEYDELGFSFTGFGKKVDYIHPSCGIYNCRKYFKLSPFFNHGSPCINNMIDANKYKSQFQLIDFSVENYVYHLGAGTVSHYGYNLNYISKFRFIKWKYRNFLNKLLTFFK